MANKLMDEARRRSAKCRPCQDKMKIFLYVKFAKKVSIRKYSSTSTSKIFIFMEQMNTNVIFAQDLSMLRIYYKNT